MFHDQIAFVYIYSRTLFISNSKGPPDVQLIRDRLWRQLFYW